MLLGLELLRPFPVFGMGLWKPPWPTQFPSSSSGADVGSTPTAVPQMEESGDRGNGPKPSLITDAEDEVAGGAAGEASSQAPSLEEDDDAVSSSAESQTGSVRGDGSATGESEGSCDGEDTRDGRPWRQLGGLQGRRRCAPIAHGGWGAAVPR